MKLFRSGQVTCHKCDTAVAALLAEGLQGVFLFA
jgi:hypothetical protein